MNFNKNLVVSVAAGAVIGSMAGFRLGTGKGKKLRRKLLRKVTAIAEQVDNSIVAGMRGFNVLRASFAVTVEKMKDCNNVQNKSSEFNHTNNL